MTLGVLLALASSLVWGSGDFCGGRASTRLNPFQVLFLVAISGLAMLVLVAFVTGESFAPTRSFLWAAGAGLAGGVGVVALYSVTNGILTIVRGASIPEMISRQDYGAIAGAMNTPAIVARALAPLGAAALTPAKGPPSAGRAGRWRLPSTPRRRAFLQTAGKRRAWS